MWAIAIAAALYAIGVGRLWRAARVGRGVSRRDVLAYAAGIVALAVALLSPLDALADRSFAAHMTQHLLLISVAAPLFILGKPVVAILWALPRSWRASVGHRIAAALAVLGRPTVAWSLNAAALVFWHVPRACEWALTHESVHVVEHATFFVTSCLFWWVVLPGADGRRLGYGAGVLAVTAMAMLMGGYGAVLTFARVPLYGVYQLADQQLAGVIMWIPTGIIYLGAALWCFLAWMRIEEPVRG